MSIFEDIIPTNEQDAVERQQAKVTKLRGLCGAQRMAIRNALDNAVPGTTVYAILENALHLPNPDEPQDKAA